MTATWDGDSVELRAFATHVNTYVDQAITHEEFTQAVALWLDDQGVADVRVETTWHTAGLDVEVTATP